MDGGSAAVAPSHVEPLLAGILEKRKEGNAWKPRYCVHIGSALLYYKPDDYTTHKPAGCIQLAGATVSTCADQICIVAVSPTGPLSFELRSSDPEVVSTWAAALTRPTRFACGRLPAASRAAPLALEAMQAELGWDAATVAAVRKAFDDSVVATADF
eukprot:SAG11_NODE_14214_length_621_cov_0.971264_1_plen_156_part_01